LSLTAICQFFNYTLPLSPSQAYKTQLHAWIVLVTWRFDSCSIIISWVVSVK